MTIGISPLFPKYLTQSYHFGYKKEKTCKIQSYVNYRNKNLNSHKNF